MLEEEIYSENSCYQLFESAWIENVLPLNK